MSLRGMGRVVKRWEGGKVSVAEVYVFESSVDVDVDVGREP